MADNQKLGVQVRDFLKTNKERKFTREELWSEVFADDSVALAVDADTQRRAIGRAREHAHELGGYITHAVAANGFTYMWTDLAENAVDPMLHYTKIVIGQEDVLNNIKNFVKEVKVLRATDKSAELDLIIHLAEDSQTQCEMARRNMERTANFLIEHRRRERAALS